MNPVSEFVLGDTVVRYRHDVASGRVGLELVPVAAYGCFALERVLGSRLQGLDSGAWVETLSRSSSASCP